LSLDADADSLFVSARAGGERLVARIRLVVLAMLLPIQLVPGSSSEERAVGMTMTAVGLAFALGIWALVERSYRPWIAVASSALDVTLISAALAAHWVLGRPAVTLNSRTTFEVYFLALLCAALRFDWRICVFTGALTVLQYGGLMLGAALHTGVRAGDIPDPRYGVFSWNIQAVRLVLLAAATVAATAAVLRTRGLRQLSTTDRLTGLLNRGAFDERLVEETSRARRHGHPFAIAIVDIDRFKDFNDSHGHLAGDAALAAVADTLRHSLRQSDLVARYGGEEFVMILPETRAQDAVPRVEAIREACAARPLSVPEGSAGVTVSIGLAGWPADGEEPDQVLAEADRRLYAAKQAGRNRLVGPPATAAAPA
jgi:diguanylate cyclase (GGDEF)-like protein